MSDNKLMWAVLVHLGNNMWNEEGNRTGRENNPEATASPVLRFDRKLYDDYLPYLREKGADTLIIDVGEALVYESHPELAVEGSWSKEKMQKELKDLRSMGFEFYFFGERHELCPFVGKEGAFPNTCRHTQR